MRAGPLVLVRLVSNELGWDWCSVDYDWSPPALDWSACPLSALVIPVGSTRSGGVNVSLRGPRSQRPRKVTFNGNLSPEAVAPVRIRHPSDHFFPNRGFAAVWEKVVRRAPDSHRRLHNPQDVRQNLRLLQNPTRVTVLNVFPFVLPAGKGNREILSEPLRA